MTERKRLKAVRRRNKRVKSYNFKTKTLKHIPILNLSATEGEGEKLNRIITSNKILRGNRTNGL